MSFDTASYNAPILKLTNIAGTDEDITINGFGDVLLNGTNAFIGTNTFNNHRPTSSLTSGVSNTEFITRNDAENRLGNISVPRFSFLTAGYWASMKIKSTNSSISRLYIDPDDANKPLTIYINGGGGGNVRNLRHLLGGVVLFVLQPSIIIQTIVALIQIWPVTTGNKNFMLEIIKQL